MKVLVTGDRHWSDGRMVHATLSNVYAAWAQMANKEPDERFIVIEGGAKGADRAARDWAVMMKPRGVVLDTHDAEWHRYGAAAGPKRNREMLQENPDLVLAFHDALTESKGTKDMVTIAEDANVKIWLMRHEGSFD